MKHLLTGPDRPTGLLAMLSQQRMNPLITQGGTSRRPAAVVAIRWRAPGLLPSPRGMNAMFVTPALAASGQTSIRELYGVVNVSGTTVGYQRGTAQKS